YRAKYTDGWNTCALKGKDERSVDLSQQRCGDGGQSHIVRHPQAVDELRFHVHPFQHPGDLNAAAMHDRQLVSSLGNDSCRGGFRFLKKRTTDFDDGQTTHRRSPVSTGRPSIRLRFSIACPAAPLTRLSIAETITVVPPDVATPR